MLVWLISVWEDVCVCGEWCVRGCVCGEWGVWRCVCVVVGVWVDVGMLGGVCEDVCGSGGMRGCWYGVGVWVDIVRRGGCEGTPVWCGGVWLGCERMSEWCVEWLGYAGMVCGVWEDVGVVYGDEWGVKGFQCDMWDYKDFFIKMKKNIYI